MKELLQQLNKKCAKSVVLTVLQKHLINSEKENGINIQQIKYEIRILFYFCPARSGCKENESFSPAGGKRTKIQENQRQY